MESSFNQLTTRSDREFGFVFAGFCSLVAAYLLWEGRSAFWVWLAASAVFLGLAIALPKALRPLNFVWLKFGLLLHAVITPIVLSAMFFAVFTPLGLLMRICGKRPLQLHFDRAARSYWITRTPPGPRPNSFGDQF